MAEATGPEATTSHELLEFVTPRSGFRQGAGLPLDCGLRVVVESAMELVTADGPAARGPATGQRLCRKLGDLDQLLLMLGPGVCSPI